MLSKTLLRAAVFTAVSAIVAPAVTCQGIVGLPEEPGEDWPHPVSDPANPFPRDSTGTAAELALRDAKVRLGKMIFWDEQVSMDNTVACGTCHAIGAGGTDDRLGAIFSGTGVNDGNFGAFGVIPQSNVGGNIVYGDGTTNIDRQVTNKHTPTMIGAFMFDQQFWQNNGSVGPAFLQEDGTAFSGGIFSDNSSMEAQAVRPPISPVEMGHAGITWADGTLQAKLNTAQPLALVDPATIPPDIFAEATAGAPYARLFDLVFLNDPNFGGQVGVTRARFAMVVAHYQRTLVPNDAPIDRGEMTPQQIEGFKIMMPFNAQTNPTGRGRCFQCHSVTATNNGVLALDAPAGPISNRLDQLLSDGLRTHDIGLPGPNRKTPTLRNVGLRKKFFSTGNGGNGTTVTNLDELIDFYDNQGSSLLGFTGTLNATERAAVKAFLEVALTDERVRDGLPPFDSPQLASLRPEFSTFEGNEYGNGTAGPSTIVPEIIANMPPLVTKPMQGGAQAPSWFKVGVSTGPALAGAPAAVLFSGAPANGPLRFIGGTIFSALPVNLDAQGIGTSFNPFPLTASAIGVPVFVQWMVRDGGGIGASDAASFTPFQF